MVAASGGPFWREGSPKERALEPVQLLLVAMGSSSGKCRGWQVCLCWCDLAPQTQAGLLGCLEGCWTAISFLRLRGHTWGMCQQLSSPSSEGMDSHKGRMARPSGILHEVLSQKHCTAQKGPLCATQTLSSPRSTGTVLVQRDRAAQDQHLWGDSLGSHLGGGGSPPPLLCASWLLGAFRGSWPLPLCIFSKSVPARL